MIYAPTNRETKNIALAVKSMAQHMTDEGWQIMQALHHAGYTLHGCNFDQNITDIRKIITLKPTTLVIQDKREWEGLTATRRNFNKKEHFENHQELQYQFDIFKITIIKDAHQNIDYNRQAAHEMGIHAWITYYKNIERFVPFVNHAIRTYHSINMDIIPIFNENRHGCLLSGALSSAYPLRQRLVKNVNHLNQTTFLKHPGYHRKGCDTPEYLRTLNKYKVAICTASIYDYALRKIIEATACGCVVITNLTEKLPEIDENLVRVPSDITIEQLNDILESLYKNYDLDKQKSFSKKCAFYDFRRQGLKLAEDIEYLRRNYVPS